MRWGKVVSLDGDTAAVLSSAIEWDGSRLSLGPRREEAVIVSKGPIRLAGELSVGDVVGLHWDWVCAAISTERLELGLAG